MSTVREWLAAPDNAAAVQTAIPILMGAMSDAGLAVAIDHANIIGFSGLCHKRGHPPGTLTAVTAEQTDQLVALHTQGRPQQAFERDVLLQAVELGRNPLPAAKACIERAHESEDPDVLADSPCVLSWAPRPTPQSRDRAAT